jgi:hypothetical protein
MARKYVVALTAEERDRLLELERIGRDEERLILRARMLLKAHEGSSDERIAESFGVAASTVARLRKRFAEGRLQAALGEIPSQAPSSEHNGQLGPPVVMPVSAAITCPDPRIAEDAIPPAPICGTQFTGTLPAGAEQQWFTFDWPATWHVVWTVMPSTVKPGAPQLTWKVGVGRSGPGRLTYWLSVKNLTPVPVTFEGRYAILGTY